MTERVWYKWPKGYIEGKVPWYIILWRLPFAAIFISAILIARVCLFFAVGQKKAKIFWRDNL